MLSCLTLFFTSRAEGVFRSVNDKVSLDLSANGSLKGLIFEMENTELDSVSFRSDKFAGPSFGPEIDMKQKAEDPFSFEGVKDGIKYSLSYKVGLRLVDVVATVENMTDSVFSPDKLPLFLGIDTYMDSYPKWNHLYFPTFFRCEKNNFWGYMMSPRGRILTVSSPDPIASYSYEYLYQMYGHYIHTVSLDLLCRAPLPEHHSVIDQIPAHEKKQWTVRLSPATDVKAVKKQISTFSKASFIELDTHSAELNKPVQVSVIGPNAEVSVVSPLGIEKKLGTASEANSLAFNDTNMYGLYWIKAVNEEGQISTASFYVHPSWSWYLKRVREQAVVNTPRASDTNDSCETWYQLLGFYLGEKHFPEPALKSLGDQLLNTVLDSIFEEKEGKLNTSVYPERIQNVSAMVSILSLKYSSDKDLNSLEVGAKCVEYLLSRQHKDGFYGGYGMAHYTSVLYIAKSIMEFMDQIKPLAENDAKWKERYERYAASVKRAVDELASRGRDIRTEGQQTFEDGAVACSSSQLLLYALKLDDPDKRMKYQKPGLGYLQDHSCLTRLLDPDARSRGATSRFWECWGDLHSPIQAMLSPHGWSAWRMYASYYAYLLTGDYDRLQQLMDALGACTQLVDYPKGDLRYAFVIDPQYAGGELLPDANNHLGTFHKKTVSTGYLKPIGEWYGQTTKGTGYMERTKWDWDGIGTAFEIFKAMEEIILPHAFICEHDQKISAYNCKTVKESDAELIVNIDEDVVTKVHFNLQSKHRVKVFKKGACVLNTRLAPGMQWVNLRK